MIINLNQEEFKKKNIFLIADTHIDHTNIIEYCNRPFHTIEEMNETIINNWNETIKKDDIVFFLGDLTCGMNARPSDNILKKLNGEIYYILGNHDFLIKPIKTYRFLILKKGRKEILLIHDPKHVPKSWKKWTIHAHHHNNHPKQFPFLNKKNKHMNISIENTDYKPISLKKILELTKD